MIHTKTLLGHELNLSANDVFGLLGVVGDAKGELMGAVCDAICEALSKITPRACYREYAINFSEDELDLGFKSVKSRDLSERLYGCNKIILMAATVGLGIDRLISKYSLNEPSKALILQAVGAAAVESWLDTLCFELGQGRVCRSRFSCGYGDLPLELQGDIFAALECEKNIGLTLNASMLMSPTKSVTAIIGIE
jgi:hypothetical protein